MSDNATRAERAFRRILDYGETGSSGDDDLVYQWMQDFLCDLHHFADERDVEWSRLLTDASYHYEAEVAEEAEAEFDVDEARKIATTDWRHVTNRQFVHELLDAACDEIEALRARAEA